MEGLTEEEKKALRGSKFAPLPSAPPPRHQLRLAHPGGPMKTNKAAALAKFLERKLQETNGLASVDPRLVELAVRNAKETVNSSCTSTSGRTIHHVDSFGDSEESAEEELEISVSKKRQKKKKLKKSEKKRRKKQKILHWLATHFQCSLLPLIYLLLSNILLHHLLQKLKDSNLEQQ